ncbi:MAG: N-acetylmuramidase family protein [Muribaculaceae bacterium]|nr:N-acetylmuramidase family protein [Muribaculaceae bacterium]
MKSLLPVLLLSLPAVSQAAGAPGAAFMPDTIYVFDTQATHTDSLGRSFIVVEDDAILHISFIPTPDALFRSGPLTDAAYEQVASELGIETAAIRAVVEIETGRTHKGLNEPGFPVINFDLPVFRKAAARRGINLNAYKSSPALKPVDSARYGGQQKAQRARLNAAMEIDSIAAIESTFWGMFQIGGFNWRLCGAPSREDFVEMMSRSEYDQLMLFANYIRNTGLLKYLKARNWSAFARIYNGPSYASRGYHTRLAAAYKKYKK